MADLHRPTKNNNSFYLKMKLFRPKIGKPEKPFFVRYFKWILWFSLSFYFFAKFLSNHESNPSPFNFKTTIINHSHRALSESIFNQPINNHGLESSIQQFYYPIPQIPKFEFPCFLVCSYWFELVGFAGLLNDLKVYVYELPSKYNSDWLSNDRCSNHLFASEVAIHRALMKSDVRTFDPTKADFFFVPVYVSCNFSTVNGFPAIGHARDLLSSAVDHISSEFPFWKQSNGSDHVFVASHDYGACFHAMEDRAIAEGIPEFMKNSIVLQTFGVRYEHPCQKVENVVIPPYVSPESVESTLLKSPIDGQRDIFVFFRGKMEVHPKNVSGRFYSKRVRTEILRKYGHDKRFYLKRHRYGGYQSEIVRSVFCLCPLGWAPWSPRIVESVALGCVPVIIADDIRLPFESVIPWSEISLSVREKDVAKLGGILDHVTATNLSSIRRNLWDQKIRRALLFHGDVECGDATWQVLVALSSKLGRSLRKSRHSGE